MNEVAAGVHLRLYVSPRSIRSLRAIEVGRALHERLAAFGGSCDILDVSNHPELADEDRILATPTLVRSAPAPPLRVIGDVSDLAGLVERLGLPTAIMDDEQEVG